MKKITWRLVDLFWRAEFRARHMGYAITRTLEHLHRWLGGEVIFRRCTGAHPCNRRIPVAVYGAFGRLIWTMPEAQETEWEEAHFYCE